MSEKLLTSELEMIVWTGTEVEQFRELAYRESGGIRVTLLWHPETNAVHVTVDDSKRGERFEVPVRSGENPLEVFHHPFAYAASVRLPSVAFA